MNRRSFLRGSGSALLGVATLGIARLNAAPPYAHVEWVMSSGYTDGRYSTKIKMNTSKQPTEYWTDTLEQGDGIARDVVRRYGWSDGKRCWPYSSKSS